MKTQIDIDGVMRVYSGINGKCCCGCAGKYAYASKYRKIASKEQDCKIGDDEISDRTVKTIVNKMNKFLAILGNHPEYPDLLKKFVSIVKGTRLYIAYFAEGVK